MVKTNGLAWDTLDLDDAGGTPRDLRNDTNSLDFATPRAVQEITGIDKSAVERQLNLADFSANLKGVLNTDVDKSHDVLSSASSSSTPRTLTIGVAGAVLANEVLATDYKLSRDQSGAVTWDAPLVLQDGTVPTWS